MSGQLNARFDPAQSAGLFIGVDNFPAGVPDIQYGVDDAIDLAHAFAFDKKINPIRPSRIVLALQGTPAKEETRKRLARLRKAGARIYEPTPENITRLLGEQARAAGAHGLLVVSIATHGFSSEGTPYVLASTSRLHEPSTSLAVPKLLETAAIAKRSLLFIDACRDRLDAQNRGAGSSDPQTAAPLLKGMTKMSGQVVFYAAAAGKYAYPDHKKMNGVFTSAVLECLRCEVRKLGRATVTTRTLSDYFETYVLKWVREHVDPSAETATQSAMDGHTSAMRLASCPPPIPLVRATTDGSHVSALDANDKVLFTADVGEPITHTEVADLDADGTKEVVVSAGNHLTTFNYDGSTAWTADTEGPVRTFLTGDFFKGKNRQVVTLSMNQHGSGSHVSLWDNEGMRLWTHSHPGEMKHLAIDRATSHRWPKIIVTAINPNAARNERASVCVLGRDNAEEWAFSFSGRTIRRLEILDIDNDAERDICVRTDEGRLCFGFNGAVKDVKDVQLGFSTRP